MKLFVTGASGLVGSRLCADLSSAGHEVMGLSRQPRTGGPEWVLGDAGEPGSWTERACAADAVFHLCGESIAEGRWTSARKRALLSSRVDSTRVLLESLAASAQRPRVLVCASACGYYGARGEEELAESSPPGSDFLAELCCAWEAEADAAERLGMRVVKLRLGVVLSAGGGALAKMLPIFRLGLGGPLGPGRRWFPWLAESDAVGLMRFALEREMSGPVNAVAPGAVRMGEFAATLGRVLRRPALLPLPEVALKLALGEMGGSLTPGQHVVPQAALEAGYCFEHPTLEAALAAVVSEAAG